MCVSGPVLFPGGAHTHRIMLLEQSPEMQSYRLNLIFAFGLLEPLLHQSILFLAHQKHTGLQHSPPDNQQQYACGGPAGYRPQVLNVYAVPLNDLSNLFIIYYSSEMSSGIFQLYLPTYLYLLCC